MKVFHSLLRDEEVKGCALALGNFDGVHVGHQALFHCASSLGKPAALTFHPHPGKVLQPQLAPKLITTLPRKLELFESCGLVAAFIQPFTLEYAKTSPEMFEASLLDEVGAQHLIIGADFTYGSMRRGNAATLAAAAAARGAQVHVTPQVSVNGVVVHSSNIREYILEGRVDAARALLGRWFDLDGVVVTGQGRGRGIGFPHREY